MTAQIGLALSGGGARGLAHIGVLKVLEKAHIPVHLLAGTSMGGIIAALYAAGRSADEIERLARSLRLLDVAQRSRSGLGLLSQDKIARRVREALEGDLTFDQLKLPLALTAVDLETGEEIVIREGSVVEGVLATTAIPIAFPPVEWRGRLLIDGGVLNQVPFDVVRQMKADVNEPVRVIAVHTVPSFCDEPENRIEPDGRGAEVLIRLLLSRTPWAPLVDIAERSQTIMICKLVEQRMRDNPPDLMIRVPLSGVGLFDLDHVDFCVRAGQEAARQHLAALIELRDTPPPGLFTRWWRSLARKRKSRQSQVPCTAK